MRGVQRIGHSERERHPNGEGLGSVGQSGHAIAQLEQGPPPQLEPPPGAPIRTAWIAGRIGLAFVDESAIAGGSSGTEFGITSLEHLESLDVEERPYIWDL